MIKIGLSVFAEETTEIIPKNYFCIHADSKRMSEATET